MSNQLNEHKKSVRQIGSDAAVIILCPTCFPAYEKARRCYCRRGGDYWTCITRIGDMGGVVFDTVDDAAEYVVKGPMGIF